MSCEQRVGERFGISIGRASLNGHACCICRALPSLYADTAPSTSELARELQWEEAPYPTVEEKAEQIQSPSSRNDDHNGEINPGISFDLSGFPQNLQREWKAIEHERLFIKEEIEKVKEGQIEYVTSLRSQMNAEFTRKVDIIQRGGLITRLQQ